MTHQRRHLTRREAERLLDDPVAAHSALGSTLASAAAPARAGELRREDAEVAAFHTARLTPTPTTRSDFVSPTPSGTRAALRAVIATGAIVALTSGGFALANSAHLPTLPGQASDQASEAIATTSQPSETTESTEASDPTETTETTGTTDPTETTGTTETETAGEETDAAEESGTPTPNFTGLCKAFQATDHSAHGSSLASAAFTALATEAGGADRIAAYCVTVIGKPKDAGKPTDKPSPTNKPTDHPTGKPSVLPTPTTKPAPTNKPTDKPSPGKPTDKPGNPGKGGGKDSSTTGS